MTNIFIN